MPDPEDREPTAAPERTDELTTADLAGGAQRPVETRTFGERPDAEAAPRSASGDGATPLLAAEEADNLRARWDEIQAGFVDEPRKAVQDADSLVAQTMKRLAEMFASERSSLEGQWDRGDEVSTEDLRQALRRYRSFFARLLAV